MRELLLTPELAKSLLLRSAQEIVRCKRLVWLLEHYPELNGTTIHFGDDGTLLDGHHRCTVVMLTGISLKVFAEDQPYHME